MISSTEPTKTNEGTGEFSSPVQAWVAVGAIDAHGRRCESQDTALVIVAVSVNENYAVGVEARVALMDKVACVTRIPTGIPSLWVYPAGFFGFDAAAHSRRDGSHAWPGVDPSNVEDKVREVVVKAYPADAWVAFGVDTTQDQSAWLVRKDRGEPDCRPVMHKIQRKLNTSLADRCVDLTGEGLKGAFFVCSEIAAYEDQFFDCRLIVNLAHVRVPGTVWSRQPSARSVHERVLAGASAQSAAILAHHHVGQQTEAREHSRHQSNWILFRGDSPDWLDRAAVQVVY